MSDDFFFSKSQMSLHKKNIESLSNSIKLSQTTINPLYLPYHTNIKDLSFINYINSPKHKTRTKLKSFQKLQLIENFIPFANNYKSPSKRLKIREEAYLQPGPIENPYYKNKSLNTTELNDYEKKFFHKNYGIHENPLPKFQDNKHLLEKYFKKPEIEHLPKLKTPVNATSQKSLETQEKWNWMEKTIDAVEAKEIKRNAYLMMENFKKIHKPIPYDNVIEKMQKAQSQKMLQNNHMKSKSMIIKNRFNKSANSDIKKAAKTIITSGFLINGL
ncbi:hypothetical protein SteCoe_20028 [Stentor coeruleus]|uniref:Uncharacterized protein n=1 Tax=Stentor coeruleus TaxID=5963 RepID=A0A1R2BSV7_9CILI|nr:hypothetical protein SteCoe_20028 [Stentor coeruleus]